MGELQNLFNVLSRDGYYDGSFEDFKTRFQDEKYQHEVFNAVSRDNLYTNDINSFKQKFTGSATEVPTYNPETIVSSSSSASPLDVVNYNIDAHTSLFNETEGEAVIQLEELYPGFVFEEVALGSKEGGGLDAIKISTKDGENSATFDMNIGGLNLYGSRNTLSEEQGRNKSFNILKDFVEKYSTKENQVGQDAAKIERRKTWEDINAQRDELVAVELAEIEEKFENGTLFNKEKKTNLASSGINTMGVGNKMSIQEYEVQVYKEELERALKDLKDEYESDGKTGQPTTEEIHERALEYIIDKAQENALTEVIESDEYQMNFTTKASGSRDYSEGLQNPTATGAEKYTIAAKEFNVDFGKDYQLLIAKALELDEGDEITRFNEINSQLEDSDFEFEAMPGESMVALQSGRQIPERIFKEFKGLNVKINNKVKAFRTFQEKVMEKAVQYSDNAAAIDIARRNYSGLEKFLTTVGLGTTEMFFNATIGMNLMGGGQNEAATDFLSDFKTSTSEIRESYAKDVQFDDAFSSLTNFGTFMAQEVANQIPVFATLAIPGIGATTLGLSAFGEHYTDLTIERNSEGGRQLSNAEMWWMSAGFGASELVFESLTTIPLLRAAKRGFQSTPGTKTLTDLTIGKYFKTNVGKTIYGTLSEPIGEGMTQLTQNLIDGKPLTQGLDHAMFSGLMFGATLSISPFARGLYLSQFNDHAANIEYRERVNKAKNLNKTNLNIKINLKSGITNAGTQADIDNNNKAIADLQAENETHVREQEALVNSLGDDATKYYFSLNSQLEGIKNEAIEVENNTTLTDQQKNDRLKQLQVKFDAKQYQKDGFRDKDAFGHEYDAYSGLDENAEDVAALKKQATEDLININIDATKGRRKEPTDIEVNQRAKFLYNVRKIKRDHAANSKAGLTDTKLFETKEEAVVWLKSLKDPLLDQVNNKTGLTNRQEAIMVIEEGGHGANLPTFGQNIPFIVANNMAADDRLETRTHEVGHSVFIKAIGSNPAAFKELSGQITEYLKQANPAAYKRLMFRLNQAGAIKDKLYDETIMVFLEEVASGKVDIAKSKQAGFLANFMNKGIEKVGGRKIDLKGETDAINFLIGIAKKIKAGTIDVSDIQAIKENRIAKQAKESAPKTKAEPATKFSKTQTKTINDLGKEIKDEDGTVTNLEEKGGNVYFEVEAENIWKQIQKQGLLDGLILAQPHEGIDNKTFLDTTYAELFSWFKKYQPERKNPSGLFGHINPQIPNRAKQAYNAITKDEIKYTKEIGETTKEGEVKIQVAAEKSAEMEAFEEEDLSIQGQAKKAKADKQQYSEYRKKLGFETGSKIYNEVLENVKKSLMIAYGATQNIADAQLRAKAIAAKMKKEYTHLDSPLFKQIKNFLTHGVADVFVKQGTKDIYFTQLKEFREEIVKNISTADLVQIERNTPEADKIFVKFVKKLTKISEVEDAVNKELLPPEALNKITKDKKTGKGSFSPSLYDKIMPTPDQLVGWADQPGKNPITGLRQGLKGTRKDGLVMRMVNGLVTDAIMEARQSDQVQDRIAGMDIDPGSVAELGAAIGREVNVKFSKSNAIEDISAAMDGSGSVNVYSQIKFSKSHREAYEKQLTKRRPDLTEEQRKGAVQSVFDFVDDKAIPNHKKSKFEKMAMHYMANGYLILPEDGYKVIEAEKIATQKKLDPFSFKNPNVLIETFVGEVKGTRTNPDNVKTFSNKTQFAGGVTVYNVEDSKQGQRDTRKVIDTHFGEKANPWCLAARTGEYHGNDQAQTLEEAQEMVKAEEAVGRTATFEKFTENGETFYEVMIMEKPNNKDLLKQSFVHWKHYNKEGNGHQIAFQNGRLVAFRDGKNDPQWWDRNDKPTSGVVIRGKKVDGFKEVIEVNKTKETLLYYEKVTGDKKNGTTIEKDLDGSLILQETKKNGKLDGEIIRVDKKNKKSNEYHRVQTENYKDGIRISYKEERLYTGKDARVDISVGRGEQINLNNITKYERYFTEKNFKLSTEKTIVEGTVNQKYFKEFNDPSSLIGFEKTNLPYLTPVYERYYGMQGQKITVVETNGNVTIDGVVQEPRVKFSNSTIDFNLHASNAKWTTLMDGKRNQVRKSRIAVRDIIDNLPEDNKAARDFFEILYSNIQKGRSFIEIVNSTWSSTKQMHPDNTILGVLSEGALTKDHLANILGQIKKTTEVEVAQIGFNESIKSLNKRLKPLRSNQKKADAIIEWFKHRGKAFKTAKVKHKGQTITTNEQFAKVVIADIAETNGVEGFGFERIDSKGNTRVTFDKKPVSGLKNITEIKQVFTNGTVEQRNEAVKQMKEESGTTIDHLMNIVAGETTVESKKSEVRSTAFDTEGGLRKIAVPARMIINYVKKVELDHRPTVNNVHKKIDEIIDEITPKNKEAKLKELRDYLEGTEVYLITKKADKIINKYKDASGQSYRTNGGKEVYEIQEVKKEIDKHEYMDFKPQFSKSQDAQTLNKAIKLSRSANNPTKGITVLDFDDTLATSKSLIRFTRPDGTKGTLNAEQYASTYENLSELGYKFDFSEFTKVVDGKTAPLFNKAMKLQGKFGPESMFVLTARPAESAGAIHAFLKANGLNIPLKNITGLANSTAEAKALWMAEKVGEGYNDFYFADDALQNVKAVKNMLNQLDVKSKVQQARVKFSRSMNEKFNDILENVTGIDSVKRFSEIKGRKRGDDKGKFRLFIPPSHEDFVGLLYNFMGKGREGDKHRDFFEQALVRPINRAYREIDTAKQAIANDYKSLNEKFPEIKDKLIKTTPDGDFTFSDAIRVYLWNKHGHKIPGLTETDQAKLTELVQSDPQLQAYAETLNIISKQETYVAPGQAWEMGNIRIDLVDATGRVGRAEYFSEFQENADVIFSEENLNKIEASYGKDFRSALEDMLHRIKTGVNRPKGASAKPNMFMNWLNASVAGVMFFNTRSALLQQMSNVNYLNFADNNIYKAGLAFANQKQYWADFAMIFNSDMMKQRRGGLGTDINGAELAEAIKKARPDSMFDQVAIITGKALQLGFLPTQIGDNIAIATGGAAFYRNRVNTYLKQGMSQKEAESAAFTDFQNITQSTQQSARPDMTSQQQASWIGKLVLNFLNTPSQYNRIIKKAALDIKNRRITGPNTSQMQSDMSNLSRMLYYGAAQNLIFYSLQTALFALMFGDDEDEEAYLKKKQRVIHGTIDTLLRGSGIYGVAVSTLKNMTIKFMEQREKGYNKDESAVLMEGLNFSPVVGIKARGIVSAEKTLNYNMPVIKEMELLDIDNPIWSATTNIIQSTTGAPANKTHQKIINLRNATDNQYTAFQRAMFLSGYTTWSLNLGDTEKMKGIKQGIKDKKKKSKKKKNKTPLTREQLRIKNRLKSRR